MSLLQKMSSKESCQTKKRKENTMNKNSMSRKQKILMGVWMGLVLTVTFSLTALADGEDPVAVVNNLSNFIFGLVRAVGMILVGFGIMQVGLSLKSHDPSQRANGIMTVAGGIVIMFAKEIMNLIVGGGT